MAHEQYLVPERDREPLRSYEKTCVEFFQAVWSALCAMAEKSPEVIRRIPNGERRFNLLKGQFASVNDDILGTIPVTQLQQISNRLKSNEIRFAPKPIGAVHNGDTPLMLDVETAKQLVDYAQGRGGDSCEFCTLDCEECRQCKLFHLLTCVVPMDDYNRSTLCPYNTAQWED